MKITKKGLLVDSLLHFSQKLEIIILNVVDEVLNEEMTLFVSKLSNIDHDSSLRFSPSVVEQ